MKKILIGFVAIGLLTFVGCEKNDDTDTETIDSTETSSDDGSTDTSDDITDSTETSSDDSSVEYGEGATDIDGNTYKSIIIGEQEWMAENLRPSKYSDGTPIPNVTDGHKWNDLTTGAWCNYNNDNQYDTIYGKLYNWYAVETGKLCPTGWHVPTDAEWTILEDHLTADGHSGSEGTALKATSGWMNRVDGTSGNGTDDYEWLGLPSAYRWNDSFYGVGKNDYWWSSSQGYTQAAYSRNLSCFDGSVYRNVSDKRLGYSVRCLRD